uniref:Uncharacterized protein n=2 Tax=Physcomitrium patens TaxID=3218 RepID=A0A7I4EMS1_PHYPA
IRSGKFVSAIPRRLRSPNTHFMQRIPVRRIPQVPNKGLRDLLRPLDFLRRTPKSFNTQPSQTVSLVKPVESSEGVGLASILPSVTEATSS